MHLEEINQLIREKIPFDKSFFGLIDKADFDPAKNLDDAHTVLMALGDKWVLDSRKPDDGFVYQCTLYIVESAGVFVASADYPEVAVCLASLKAVGAISEEEAHLCEDTSDAGHRVGQCWICARAMY